MKNPKLKFFILVNVLFVLLVGGWGIKSNVSGKYHFENEYHQLWQLADKSSTIPAKQVYIKQFADKLQEGYSRGDFTSHNAIWLETPSNDFQQNLKALNTLSERLTEIQVMDPTSFQYNTAIQQITAQEQGEAHSMIEVFEGCYLLKHYPLAWDWIGEIVVILSIITTILAIICGVVLEDC